MELRCNSSDSSTNSNACLTPGPPCCERYSSRFASAARFTTTHLRKCGMVRAMCHNASIGVFGSLADCGVSARGGGGGCNRPLFGVCAVCSVLANRFALLRRRGACDAVRDAACLRRAARSGMPARRAGMHDLRARAWGSGSISNLFPSSDASSRYFFGQAMLSNCISISRACGRLRRCEHSSRIGSQSTSENS